MMRISFKQSIMKRYHSYASNVMRMDTCSDISHRIKNQEERNIKKIKIPRGLPESKIRKDQPRKLWALKPIKKYKLKIGLNSSKNSSKQPLSEKKIFKISRFRKPN